MTKRYIAAAVSLAAASMSLTACNKKMNEAPQTPQEQVDVGFTPEMQKAQQEARSFVIINVMDMAQKIDQQRAAQKISGPIDANIARSVYRADSSFSLTYSNVERCARRGQAEAKLHPSSYVDLTCSDENGRPVLVASGDKGILKPGMR